MARPSRRTAPWVAVPAAVLMVVGLASGCLDTAKPDPAAKPTPIGRLDTSHMVIPRRAFCDKIPTAAVDAAIKGHVDNSRDWSNGQQAGSTTDDVAQEFGCEWKSADGVAARAWVFARPVTRGYAGQVIRQSAHRSMCHTAPPPHFGRPSLLQICQLGGGVLRVRHAGLFGDAWLTCEVAEATGRQKPLRRRADAWCVTVAKTLSGSSAG